MRRRRWAIVVVSAAAVAVAVVVVLIVLAASPRRTPGLRLAPSLPGRAAPRAIAYGAAVNLLFETGAFDAGQVAASLRALRMTGATLARSDALWEATEPVAPVRGVHRWHWLFDDIVAAQLARAGLSWLAIIDYSAPWAQSVPGEDHSPPRSDADYAAYAQAFAARYGTGGSFWRSQPELPRHPVTTLEIWNEPDNAQFWYPHPDPAAYARLYALTRRAVDAVDPSMRVIVGGLVSPTRTLPAMVAAMPSLRGHVDGVAIHPYGRPATVLSRVRAARATLRSLGMGSVPLYVTEFGWTTSPPGAISFAPAARRPAYLHAVLSELSHSDCGLAAVSLYTWASPRGPRADSADWYGIAGDAPVVAALRAGLASASGAPAARPPSGAHAARHGAAAAGC